MIEPGDSQSASSPVQARATRRLISPLTLRILAVNILALAIPVVGLLYLGPYQDGLLDAELDGLRRQSDIFAGALGEGAIRTQPDGAQALNILHARNMIRRLTAATPVRARLFLTNGELVADSRSVGGRDRMVQIFELSPPHESSTSVEHLMDMLDWVFDALQGVRDLDLYQEPQRQSIRDYPEAMSALSGDVTGVVRADRDGGYMLSVAMPVQRFHQVIGVLMVSKSGAEVRQTIRDVRLVVVELFAIALVITVLLSLYLAGAIARPMRRLAAAAAQVRGGRELLEIPDLTHRGDEIGDLSGALRDMTSALYLRIDAIERFAADVSHEIKNPLTSLRSAVETAARITDPAQQKQLMAIIQEDVQRLDRLITDISDYSRLDAELSRESMSPVDIGGLLKALVDIHAAAHDEDSGGDDVAGGVPRFRVHIAVGEEDAETALTVPGWEGRLVQVFRNLIANADSFAIPGTTIDIEVARRGAIVETVISDTGPGLPDGKLDAVFDRFYSERPASEKFGMHSGLGLSISRQIVEAHGGSIHADNRRGENGVIMGARFTVRLPI
ncbi:MAG: HAMP domain-containing protein [Rhodospirillaceae bacterium]|jgi:two-component system, OmpR family, sensor histidine kinase ChvG|nr:HAMP domain-containing protein [Rhodospirillaceae bacterium]MBT5811921.1 HAMP domain-containing protein [Rhodospirillaceae bacterium]